MSIEICFKEGRGGRAREEGGGEAREQQYAFMKINVVFMKNDGEKKGIIVMV
jgi:hypothetical protein